MTPRPESFPRPTIRGNSVTSRVTTVIRLRHNELARCASSGLLPVDVTLCWIWRLPEHGLQPGSVRVTYFARTVSRETSAPLCSGLVCGTRPALQDARIGGSDSQSSQSLELGLARGMGPCPRRPDASPALPSAVGRLSGLQGEVGQTEWFAVLQGRGLGLVPRVAGGPRR